MEFIDNSISETRLINYLSTNVKNLIKKPNFNKYKIINICMNIVESYFSGKKKYGETKQQIVINIINKNLDLSIEEIILYIKSVCDLKQLKKYSSKFITFLQRMFLKYKIKKNL